MKQFLKPILIIIVVLLAIYIGISYFAAYNVVSPTAKHIDLSADFISKDYKDVSFKTSDGLTLKGWLMVPSAKKFIIFVPGILDNRTNQGYYGVSLTQELISKGYGVLLYDPRARGDSEGTTRLRDEKEDVIAAVNFLKSQNVDPKSIGLISYSTGALSTLLAVDKINDIGGIVLDSTPTDFKNVISYVMTSERGVPGVFLWPTYFILSKIDGIVLDPTVVLSHLANATNIPLLVLHAKNDTTVPVSNSEMIIAKANKDSKLVVFPKGSHIETYKYNVDMYRQVVFDYLDNHIK